MQVNCPRCGQLLEYSAVPPRFCSNCGRGLEIADFPTQPCTPRGEARPETAPEGPTDAQATLPFHGDPGDSASAVLPDQVGGYRLVRRLGGGGMGSVFEAVQESTGRRVALKLIRPEFADSADRVERFRREGRLASTISHPRSVFVLAADLEAGLPYIVMELMPGDNLQNVVNRRGPLPTVEAVRYILDVIEGLQEAHRCGVIHRDVKPSNCFLDADGRVKVGDFGLSRSLVGNVDLTGSGAFLGTLLFAAPEQIRRDDHLDHLVDVYSVCATLYYLLTGKAPFEGPGDAAAVLARTVTEPPVPLRSHRPDLPTTLEEVILRGLSRNRSRRWRSLEELRLALLPFVPGNHALGDVGFRCLAYLVDVVVLIPVDLVGDRLLWPITSLGPAGQHPLPLVHLVVASAVALLLGVLYFGLSEWCWGCSFGKYLFRLRVRTAGSDDRPSLLRSCLRTAAFYLCKNGFALLLAGPLMGVLYALMVSSSPSTPRLALAIIGMSLLPILGNVAGLTLVASSMRRRNGYQGLHERLSGTRTIHLPGRREDGNPLAIPARVAGGYRPAGLPERVGGFTVLSAWCWTDTERLLLARDPVLERQVWIWMRPEGEPRLPARRGEVSRATRARWLGSGACDGWQWDAFVASAGSPLVQVAARRRLRWVQTLELLTGLTDELLAAGADGTLPERLGLDQVWVQPTGRPLLLDTSPRPDPAVRLTPLAQDPLDLLRQVAAVALLGVVGRESWGVGREDSRAEDHAPTPPRPHAPRPLATPLPGHAAELLARLNGLERPFANLAEFREALEQILQEPPEVERPRRALALATQGALLAPGLLCLFALGPVLLVLGFLGSLYGGLVAEKQRQETTDRLLVEATGLTGTGDPWQQLGLAVCCEADSENLERLEERLARLTREQQLMLESTSGFIQRGVPRPEQISTPHAPGRMPSGQTWTRNPDEQPLELPWSLTRKLLHHRWIPLAVLGFWPLLWVVGSALVRGRPSLRVGRIQLVQADGQPAARWRCAWRTLLVWLPIYLLLVLSLTLDLWRLEASWADPDLLFGAAWLSWLCWWLAVGLLGFYPWVALRWPDRGPHDVLAGTWLMPR
jgi:hypothetical protein